MRLVFGIVLLLGLGLAGFAVYMARDFYAQQEAQLAAERAARAQIVPTTEVYITTRPIRYGERLGQDDVAAVRWPVDAVPEGTFQTAEDLFPNGGSQPRYVLRALEQGEPLMAVKVSAPGADAGIRSRISPGMRAFTINVNVGTGVGGLLRPGDKVDVSWTGRSPTTGQTITQQIESGVEIIAIDQSADPDFEGTQIARTVTVEATSEQVLRLQAAQNIGTLSLSLIGLGEDINAAATAGSTTTINANDVLGIQAPEAIQQEERCYQTVRRGAQTERIEIPCTN
ncbi:Flp pilus assembly protein CpaB [Pseudaestuariivita rosea]|uniref:Flp pilus assembly protein CpaB n=1 Tax=Pseudaestuariivita rosea TaxID=2763263 RepID=UPI001ABAA938|nr:Flp pilus assembly protein CpaB [Pseudaestuariivita rosea]